MNTSVEYRLMMGHTDVSAQLSRKRQRKIHKAMANYKLAVENGNELARDTFLDEILYIEREYQEELEEYDKMFDYALSFEREKKENNK